MHNSTDVTTQVFATVKNIVWPDYDEIREFTFAAPGSRGPLFLGYESFNDHIIPFGVAFFYAVTVYGLRKIWDAYNLPVLPLKWYYFFHNLFLSLFSLHITFSIAWDLQNLYYEYDLHTLLCDTKSNSPRGRLMWWYYLFYLSKYFELLETYMLIFTRRPIIFLHVYHHFITLIMSYVNLVYDVGPQWVVIIANSSVHIIMYFYYALKSLGSNPWWKKYVTKFQIFQFLFDLSMAIIGWAYMYSNNWGCSGGPWLWGFDVVVVLSFLFLFLRFYRRTYGEARKPGHEGRRAEPATAAAKKPKPKKTD